jgi:HEPN domain-containing protein
MLPERREDTRGWIGKALQDLHAAEWLLAHAPPLDEPALFHCQQAAEKALKAFMVWHDHPFSRTHDLSVLVALCVSVDPTFSALQEAARILTPYAVALRYPPTGIGDEEAVPGPAALQLAHDAVSFVLDRLPPEVRAQDR